MNGVVSCFPLEYNGALTISATPHHWGGSGMAIDALNGTNNTDTDAGAITQEVRDRIAAELAARRRPMTLVELLELIGE